ncbi:hypothetical protein SAMN05216428_102331 [Nitrosospira sp. Nsp11]|uniref:hypothetical protein n=1 Tax=Nitrosospira sp. Nsp11 TaxID=1855338 RepID=UPI00090F2C9D|nr:hypothetical protein [Nitrosospira sp. Nsp11]SHL41530.1 hypothetical protein SAMN05216428_102331 [Nitrosospira sp. Nsp11]
MDQEIAEDKQMQKQAVRLVMIEWKDSRRVIDGWSGLAEIGKQNCCDCVSVGFLIQDDENVKVLVANVADVEFDMQATAGIVIPTGAVTAIKPLVERLT